MDYVYYFAVFCAVSRTSSTSSLSEEQTLQSTNCLNALTDCIQDIRCKMTWMYFNETCRGNDCFSTSTTQFCYAGYNTFMEDEYKFANCRCDIFLPRFADCQDIQKTILRNPCRKGSTDLLTNFVAEESVPPQTCVEAKQTCIVDSTCAVILQAYTDSCDELSDDVCSSSHGNNCTELKRELNKTVLKDCACPVGNNRNATCEHIWETLHRNPCAASCETVSQNEELTGGGNNDVSTCQIAVDQCHSNSTCHNYFYSYLSACLLVMPMGRCNHEACMRAMRGVFTTVPPSLTHDLVFCHCKDGDNECQVLKSALIPQCVEGNTPAASCLAIKTRCEMDPCCKPSYQHMVEHCRFRNDDCIGGYAACRTAFVGTFGTILTTRCVCEEEDPAKQEVCLEYLQLVTQNPCVEKAANAYFFYTNDHIGPGCLIRTDDHRQVLMSEGVYVKLSTRNGTRILQKACLCAEGGVLVNCFSLPTNHVEPCHENHASNSAFPLLKVAFSEREVELVNGVLNDTVTALSIAGHLHRILVDVLHEQRCNYTYYKHDRYVMTFLFTNNCSLNLEQLADMINTRHPIIEHDLLLSVLKLAVVVRQPAEYGKPWAVDSGSCVASAEIISVLLLAYSLFPILLVLNF